MKKTTRSAHSGTENKNERATLPEGTGLRVFGRCEAYYRAEVEYEFTDGSSTNNAFILTSDINIPVAGITIDKTSIEMKKGERARKRNTGYHGGGFTMLTDTRYINTTRRRERYYYKVAAYRKGEQKKKDKLFSYVIYLKKDSALFFANWSNWL